MTEWDAGAYVERSGLQQAMAAEVLALLTLDLGCAVVGAQLSLHATSAYESEECLRRHAFG
jgi:hypothetical protein